MILLIKLILLLRDHILVAETFCLDVVQLRIHLYHLDGVLLHHDGNGEQDDLGDQCKEYDRKTVILKKTVAVIHKETEEFSDQRHHWYRSSVTEYFFCFVKIFFLSAAFFLLVF